MDVIIVLDFERNECRHDVILQYVARYEENVTPGMIASVPSQGNEQMAASILQVLIRSPAMIGLFFYKVFFAGWANSTGGDPWGGRGDVRGRRCARRRWRSSPDDGGRRQHGAAGVPAGRGGRRGGRRVPETGQEGEE